MNAGYQAMLKRVRKRTMANIVQQNSNFCRQLFFLRNFVALNFQNGKSLAHKMKSAQGVMKAGMDSTGINIIAKAQLLYAAQTLEIRMLYNVKNQLMGNGNKTMHRVVEYFALIHWCEERVKLQNPKLKAQRAN